MRILTISNLALIPYQGSGQTRIGWTEGLRKLNHEVKVLQPSDFELWPVLKKGKRLRISMGIFNKGLKLLRKEKYDVIEFYGDSYWILLLWLKYFKKDLPLIVAHADGLELNDMDKGQKYWDPLKGVKKWIYYDFHYQLSKINFSIADALVCNCESDKDYAIEHKLFPVGKALCIPPGINNLYHSIPFVENKEKTIIYVGTWIGRKAVNVIPPVIGQVLLKNPDYEFHIYGAYDSKDIIEGEFPIEVRPRLKIFNKLPVNDLLEGFKKAAIYFFPSYSEGLPLATVEVMSCSCAVVTTPTGLGSNLINNKEALICNFDDVESMVQAINSLINDEDKRKTISYNGYKKSKEFVWESQVLKLENFYQTLLKEKKGVKP